MCGVIWAYTGPPEQVDATFAPIRTMFGPPALDWVGPITHPALQSMFDGIYPPGDQWYWKADFVREIPDMAIELNLQYAAMLPTTKSTMHLYPIDGAAARVRKNATTWNYRDAKWGMVIVAVSPDPTDNASMIAWARAYWRALHPYSAGGALVSMMMDTADEGALRVRASYGEHYEPLAAIKTRYDCNNLFRVSQDIKPA